MLALSQPTLDPDDLAVVAEGVSASTATEIVRHLRAAGFRSARMAGTRKGTDVLVHQEERRAAAQFIREDLCGAPPVGWEPGLRGA